MSIAPTVGVRNDESGRGKETFPNLSATVSSETNRNINSTQLVEVAAERGSLPESTFAIKFSSVLNEIFVEVRVELNERNIARKHRKFEI